MDVQLRGLQQRDCLREPDLFLRRLLLAYGRSDVPDQSDRGLPSHGVRNGRRWLMHRGVGEFSDALHLGFADFLLIEAAIE